MAVIVADSVSKGRCDACPLDRVIVTETEPTGVRVTVLEGCRVCEGSTLVLAR